MATYYVDGNSGNDANNGSSGSPWKSLGKARNSVQPGDEIRIRSASYHEQLTISTANTTWRADTGHKPVIDGHWSDALMTYFQNGERATMAPGGPGHLPGGEYGNMVLVDANGVVLDGLTVQNCNGAGIGIGTVADVVVRNCRVDFTRDFNLHVTGGPGGADRIIFENNVLTRGSVRTLVPGLWNWGGAIAIGNARDCIVRNNLVAFIWGEGIDPHRGAVRTIVEGNVIHSCMSTHIYIQRAKDNIIRNNIIYHTGKMLFTWPDKYVISEGIMIADEASSIAFPFSSGDHIYNNIVVGTGILFCVGNGSPIQNTQLNKSYIGYNTFIGNSRTYIGIIIPDNTTDPNRQHVNSIFENNIICNVPPDKPISVAGSKIGGLLFRHNLWDRLPVSQMRGNGDRIGSPALTNPSVEIPVGYPDMVTTTIEPKNYQLSSNSNLAIGMASDGSAANGMTPPVIQKDFFGSNRDSQPDIGAHEYAGVTIILTANFSIGPGQAAGQLPHTVDFTDKSTSTEPIVSRLWDFGDDETSTELNPSHTYTTAGDFDVTLTITDAQGGVASVKQEGLISVTEAPNVILPKSFRRFTLIKSDETVLAYGTQYPDMRCILIWNSDPFHILNFDNIEDVLESTAESEEIELYWIDQDDQGGFVTRTRFIPPAVNRSAKRLPMT